MCDVFSISSVNDDRYNSDSMCMFCTASRLKRHLNQDFIWLKKQKRNDYERYENFLERSMVLWMTSLC